MAQAFYGWPIWNRFFESISVRRVADPSAVIGGYKMAGILFARDAADAMHTVPQLLTQRMAKEPGESDLSATQG